MSKQVSWALLLERSVGEHAVASMLDVAGRAGMLGYTRIFHPYTRTDIARNNMVKVFLERSSDPGDTLVMLDADHLHPPDIIERLAAHPDDLGVVGALAFRRGWPHYPCFFVRDEKRQLRIMSEWPTGGLLSGAIVGTGAVAIKRWVFDTLDQAGYGWPYFRYTYPAGQDVAPSEDVYFGECCEACGIPHYCDASLITPHITFGLIDDQSWKDWQADHPESQKPDFDYSQLFAFHPKDHDETPKG